jgi:hypothetical protein
MSTDRRQIEQIIARADKTEAQTPGVLDAEAKSKVAAMRDVLERGLPAAVDVENGIIAEWGSTNLTTRIDNFRWLEVRPEDPVTVEGRDWLDLTAGPLGGGAGPTDLVMFLHSGTWRPGMPKQDMDGRVLDLKSGRLWRIPYSGVGSLPGCFLKGRESVVVTGVDPDRSSFAPYRIDLRDGAVTPLGGGVLESGIVGRPALSPDGKTLALVHLPSVAAPEARQVYRVDVETGEATAIGKPVDANAVSWLPDGKGLILGRMDYPDMKKPWVGMVCRLALDGTLTEMFPGADPAVLDARRMVFRDQSADVWKTCDLGGKDVKLFGDGLKGHAFPAPSPDGKRILFMRIDPEVGPRPYVFNADGTGGKPVTDVPGLWAAPAWR